MRAGEAERLLPCPVPRPAEPCASPPSVPPASLSLLHLRCSSGPAPAPAPLPTARSGPTATPGQSSKTLQ
ncbi:unnamed protein product [Coccothraustes coccothraustes]